MKAFITKDTPVTDEVLNTIAHLPTKSLSKIVEDDSFEKLTDRDFMRIGVLLAKKGYDEGGCPIGGVIVNNETRQIVGKGHNTLVQENHPYNHGETSAARDAGRIDFSQTTILLDTQPLRHLCGANLPSPVQSAGRRRRHKFLRHGRPDSKEGRPGGYFGGS